MRKSISILLSCVILGLSFLVGTTCKLQLGMGEIVDTEAPELKILKMESGGSTSKDSFGTLIYTKKTLSFYGKALDNIGATRVYSEIKWLGEKDYSYLKDANLEGENWTLPIDLNKEGACWIKITTRDAAGNYSVKSAQVVTLFVDDQAPVGSGWYIDRLVEGIHYDLKGLAELKKILSEDSELLNPENKEVAQNGEFVICASFSDSSGIGENLSIKLYDENGTCVTPVAVPNSEESLYSPKFKINGTALGLPSTGKNGGKEPYYYQVRYTAEDIVTDPAPNGVTDQQVALGWFMWWPEMDTPRISISGLKDDVVSIHVRDSINITVFDDDELTGSVVCTPENKTPIIGAVKQHDRETSVKFEAPDEPENINLTVTATDSNGKTLNKTILLKVSSDDKPTFVLTKPENNQTPAVTGTDSNITFAGKAVDKIGCEFLEFVWVPKGKDKNLAVSLLNDIKNQGDTYKPAPDKKYKKTLGATIASKYEGLKLYSVKLNDNAEDNAANKLKNADFDFELSLFKDFIVDESNISSYTNINDYISDNTNEYKEEKYFYIRLIRTDGNYSDSEVKLTADNLMPEIVPIVPAGNMAFVDSDYELAIEFKGYKENGVPMNTEKYKVCYVSKIDDSETELPGSINANGNYEINTALTSTELKAYIENNENPKFKYYVEDMLGNKNSGSYQFVMSELPEIKAVTSSSPENCKAGDTVIFNVSFSKPVSCNNQVQLKLKGITSPKNNKTASDVIYADYVSGSDSTTLVFGYKVETGDTSSGIQIYNEDNKGPLTVLTEKNAHLQTLNQANILAGKTITIDGVAPYVLSAPEITTEGATAPVNGVEYLKEGTTIRATVYVSEAITVQGSPKFELINGTNKLVLDWESVSPDNTIVYFSKKITSDTPQVRYSYNNASYITNYNVIKDSYGNSLTINLVGTTTDTNIVVDRTKPVAPVISSTKAAQNDAKGLKSGKYANSVEFTIATNNEKTELSLDGGKSWSVYYNPLGTTDAEKYPLTAIGKISNVDKEKITVSASASLIAKCTDYAGNISDYSDTKNIEINSTFPEYSVECITAEGNYKTGTIEFRVNFANPVNISSDSTAYIELSGYNQADTFNSQTNGNRALIDSSSKNQTEVTEALFKYTIKTGDNFTARIAADAVHLTGFVDEYGVEQGAKTTVGVSWPNLKCDTVAPFIKTMTPGGTKTTATLNSKSINVYSAGKTITLEFNENVVIGDGKIYLRQVAGWAIPAMFEAKDFNTVVNAVKKADVDKTKTNNLTGTQVLYLDGLQDYEWIFANLVGPANDRYHGTGQYAGPYKKTMQGINNDGTPDLSVKYVLDYDVDLWTDNTVSATSNLGTNKTNFGTTFESGHTTGKSGSDNYSKISKTGQVTVIKPANRILTSNIRYVLEQAHFHERYMDVASTYVEYGTTGGVQDKSKIVLNFPESLLGEAELEPGREWELVIEKGAFKDETGFDLGDGVTEDSIMNNDGTYDTTAIAAYARKRATIPSGSKAQLVIKNGNNMSFLSSGVAKPVIRVDRYSYGFGTYQPAQDGTLGMILATGPTTGTNKGYTTGSTVPTGYVRVRIDCETKEATVRYESNKTDKQKNNVSNTASHSETNNGKTSTSYCTSTTVTLPSNPSESTVTAQKAVQRILFRAGSGGYNKSSKQYIKADATYSGMTSDVDVEGIFQTVLNVDNPKTNGGTSASSVGAGKRDVNIRGTTGFAGEPSIAPFPLRDSAVGSPWLRQSYQDTTSNQTTQYYWISYEILVDSSFSIYSSDGNKYDWGCNWGLLKPGEFSSVTGITRW